MPLLELQEAIKNLQAPLEEQDRDHTGEIYSKTIKKCQNIFYDFSQVFFFVLLNNVSVSK